MAVHNVSQPQPQPSPLRFFETVQGYQRTFVLKAGVDLDIFTTIAKGSQKAADIARACGAQERGVRILCDALTVMGFLTKSGDRYGLTPDTAMFLDSRSPAYMGKALQFLLHPGHFKAFENLTEAVRKGGCASPLGTLAPEDPIWLEFARGMAPMAFPSSKAIAQLLQPALAPKSNPKVLDIAAGHGMFGIAVAQRVPSAQIYAVDWANVLQVAGENAGKMGVGQRHHLLPGSAFDVELGSGYEAALVTNFLHHFEPPVNEKLLRKIHAALRPGGQLVILEFVPNEDRVSPPMSALFSVTMLGTTPQGDAFTFPELSSMCRNAGFIDPQLIPLEGLPQSLVVSHKAG